HRGGDRRGRGRRRRAGATSGGGLERRRGADRAPAGPGRAAGVAGALGNGVRAGADVSVPQPPEVGRWVGMGEAIKRMLLGAIAAAVGIGGIAALIGWATGHSVSG